ncbi:MAG TPA: carboxypeptidase regulatory-like domain-containing protein [Bacteroidota bacterium]|nr:carboxypeptidase regulatory-like domain-containing protein [Bacteroidota bacterium]
MMCTKVNEYYDDELRPDERNAFEEHLIECPACQDELERLLALQYRIVALPKAIKPKRDLWPEIEAALESEPKTAEEESNLEPVLDQGGIARFEFSWYMRAAAVFVLVLAAGVIWFIMNTPSIRSIAVVPEEGISGTNASQAQNPVVRSQEPSAALTPSPSEGERVANVERERPVPATRPQVVAVSNEENPLNEAAQLEQRLKQGLQLKTTALLPTSAGKVVGSVSDEQGKPVQGMTVEIMSIHRTTLTDNSGKFEFFGLLPDAYTIRVHGIGYQRNEIPGVKIIPGFTTQVNFLLRSGSVALNEVAMNKEQLFTDVSSVRSLDELPSASYVHPTIQSNRLKVEGKVTDERGHSIVGAVVLVLGTTRGGYSDNDGNFHIYGVPPGSYTLQATAPGFQSRDSMSVKVYSDFPIEVNMALETAEE